MIRLMNEEYNGITGMPVAAKNLGASTLTALAAKTSFLSHVGVVFRGLPFPTARPTCALAIPAISALLQIFLHALPDERRPIIESAIEVAWFLLQRLWTAPTDSPAKGRAY